MSLGMSQTNLDLVFTLSLVCGVQTQARPVPVTGEDAQTSSVDPLGTCLVEIPSQLPGQFSTDCFRELQISLFLKRGMRKSQSRPDLNGFTLEKLGMVVTGNGLLKKKKKS